MSKSEIQFSIIVITFNGAKKIEHCLESIFKIDFPLSKFEVIVVDDCSTDHTVQLLKRFPVQVVRHTKNGGVAKSRNTGLSKAIGQIIVCLDDDCTVNSSFLQAINEKYQDVYTMGVASHLTVPKHKTLIDDYFSAIWYGLAVPKPKQAKNSIFARLSWYYRNNPWRENRDGYVDGASLIDIPGACASYRSKLLHKIGGWDEKLSKSAEDNDVTIRMITAYPNLDLKLAKNAVITHHQALSFIGTLKREYVRRNIKLLFFKKHNQFPVVFPNPVLFVLLLPTILVSPFIILISPLVLYPWWAVRFLRERKMKYIFFAYLQGIQELFSNLTTIVALLT